MSDRPEHPERDDEREQPNQDPAPTQASDAERVTGEQSAELDSEPAGDEQQQND